MRVDASSLRDHGLQVPSLVLLLTKQQSAAGHVQSHCHVSISLWTRALPMQPTICWEVACLNCFAFRRLYVQATSPASSSVCGTSVMVMACNDFATCCTPMQLLPAPESFECAQTCAFSRVLGLYVALLGPATHHRVLLVNCSPTTVSQPQALLFAIWKVSKHPAWAPQAC